jgi:hypothetical protein
VNGIELSVERRVLGYLTSSGWIGTPSPNTSET